MGYVVKNGPDYLGIMFWVRQQKLAQRFESRVDAEAMVRLWAPLQCRVVRLVRKGE